MNHDGEQPVRSRKATAALAFTALGVVYGDIGTSPLYALRECFTGPHSMDLTRDNVLGILSLIFWSLNFVISFKYIGLVLRADNRGEGGILSLLALIRPEGKPRGRGTVLMLGLFGAALLYGDGIITPAISVMSAVEGLEFKTHIFQPWIIPIALVIITGVFALQRFGTAGVGRVFGPVTAIWFVCIALLGIRGVMMHPGVLAALNPWHGVMFFVREGAVGFTVLAAVVLVITGGEALYADLGHFGRRPIRLAWFAVVLPALVLNYFGQGAWLLENPTVIQQAVEGFTFNPFYALVPDWAIYPMIGIATCAAVVASQALISGAFSLTRQAMQLGFAPRMQIVHTSHTERGQIYIPGVNWAIWAACIALVLAFRSSGSLAATYGVAVTQTMMVTTLLFAVLAYQRWGWPLWRAVLLVLTVGAVDLAFLSANLLKVPDGGWFPLMVAAIVFLLLTTWKRGRKLVTGILRESSLPLDLFVPDIERRQPVRVPGVAVFMTSLPDVAPPVLLHHLKHNKVLHETVVLMTIQSEEVPLVPPEHRVTVTDEGSGVFQALVRYGYMETPDVPSVLTQIGPSLKAAGADKPPSMRVSDISFYLGRETLIMRARGRGAARSANAMAGWRTRIFGVMSRNAQPATAFFGLPPNRVIELGAQIQV